MAFNIYISHSTSPWELAHVYALAEEAARQGLGIYLPDRTWDPHGPAPGHISGALSQADAILLFATLGGYHVDHVNAEISLAQGRPVLALVEPGIQLQGIPPGKVILLDRGNIAVSVGPVLSRLQSLKLSKDTSNLLAGFLIGALGLLVLRAAVKKGQG